MKSHVTPARNPEIVNSVARKHIQIPDNPPEMLLIIGPCRVGTTALSNSLSRLGFTAYMQPIKSMRRAAEEEEPVTDWKIDGEQSYVISKETLGPKTEAEFFNPLEILLELGYPAHKLHLIGICREPRSTLGSWVRMWNKVPINGFIKSFQLTNEIIDQAQKCGINTAYYVHEAIGANNPDMVLDRLIKKMAIPIKKRSLNPAKWTSGPAFASAGSNIALFDNPPDRFITGVKEGTSYHYRLLLAELSAQQDEAIKENKIYEIYEKFAVNCEKNLNISILEKK